MLLVYPGSCGCGPAQQRTQPSGAEGLRSWHVCRLTALSSIRTLTCRVPEMFNKALVFQNPATFKGVMQKLNPFTSASQVGTASSSLHRGLSVTDVGLTFLTQVSKSQSSESLEQVSTSNQVGETPASRHQRLTFK